ncbi:hypothetical protein Nepgr_022886 [Nepenthes gracilis]|uniref:Uncharacterized protein n=1 Tax=Nepenthes gracilis TaxID=150966 RepID=A0AAD3XYI3_NEPGR|nr:hypothetical protein Nepgr_022886 [Nepenthes gracilis]
MRRELAGYVGWGPGDLWLFCTWPWICWFSDECNDTDLIGWFCSGFVELLKHKRELLSRALSSLLLLHMRHCRGNRSCQ